MAGNFVAGDGEHQRLRVSFTRNSDLDDGALGTLEHVGDIAGGQTIGGLVVHLHDDVAGTSDGVVGGRARVRRQNSEWAADRAAVMYDGPAAAALTARR